MLQSFGVLAFVASQAFPSLVFAQSNACPPNSVQQDGDRKIRVAVDQVALHGNPLSEAETASLVKEIEQTPRFASSATEQDWAIEIMEVPIRGALQDRGYFRVVVQGAPYLIRALDHELHYGLRVEIESGRQYRLGNVRIINKEEDKALVFSQSLLRQQLDLNSGDLFSASKVRKAMENMTKLYGSKGYIDMVPAPETTTREDDSRVDLILRIDEGKSYRISQILVLSADAGTNKQLQLPQSAGDYLSRDLWWNFFKDNQSRFGPHTTFENALRCERNVRDGTLQVTLDFAACPQP